MALSKSFYLFSQATSYLFAVLTADNIMIWILSYPSTSLIPLLSISYFQFPFHFSLLLIRCYFLFITSVNPKTSNKLDRRLSSSLSFSFNSNSICSLHLIPFLFSFLLFLKIILIHCLDLEPNGWDLAYNPTECVAQLDYQGNILNDVEILAARIHFL